MTPLAQPTPGQPQSQQRQRPLPSMPAAPPPAAPPPAASNANAAQQIAKEAPPAKPAEVQAPPPMPAAPPSNHGTSIKEMVKDAHARKASDIHIRVGQVPRYRIRGQMLPIEGLVRVTPELFEHFLAEILTKEQRIQFAKNKELDTAIFYPGLVRCRVNCFDSLTGGAMVLRLISLEIPSVQELGLPEVLQDIISRPQGLILITGPTGSGKSTTLAAMIRHLNETACKHIVTIEDPIEYVHSSRKCLISQREVGLHTHEFLNALRAVLREDPDVILIGEMRDRITINTALQAAQTGHLVLGTLHTRNAINSINRLLNLYTPEEQPTMRIQITESLVAVIAQLLVQTTEGGRTAVHDILVNTPAMQDYLLKSNEDDAIKLMETDTFEGMRVLNQALCRLVLTGRVAIEAAEKISPDPNDLDRRLRTGGIEQHRAYREF